MNHGQVASGEVPESVVDNDIDAELSEEDAHANYAIRSGLQRNLILHTINKLFCGKIGHLKVRAIFVFLVFLSCN